MYDRTESNMRKNTTVRSQVWDISLTPPTHVSFSLVYSLLLRIIACTHRSYTVKKSSQKGLTCSHPWFEEGRGGEGRGGKHPPYIVPLRLSPHTYLST